MADSFRIAMDTGAPILPNMISFIFSLDHGATSMQETVIRSGLEARFPKVRFDYGAEVIDGFENSIIPVAGEPHPIEPDVTLMTPIPAELVAEVREAFQDLLQQAKTIRSS
jgi:hypothetical protein